jgi:hypothetical protein
MTIIYYGVKSMIHILTLAVASVAFGLMAFTAVMAIVYLLDSL